MVTNQTHEVFQEWKAMGSVTLYSDPTPWGQIYRRSGLLYVHKNQHKSIMMVYLEKSSYSGEGFYILEKGNFSVGDSTYSYSVPDTGWYLNV